MGLRMKEGFILIERFIFHNDKFINLSYSAQIAYICLINDRCRKDQSKKSKRKNVEDNKHKLTLTYSEMSKRMSRGTLAKAFKELEDAGFIKTVNKGGLMKNYNVFSLSNNWNDKIQV